MGKGEGGPSHIKEEARDSLLESNSTSKVVGGKVTNVSEEKYSKNLWQVS